MPHDHLGQGESMFLKFIFYNRPTKKDYLFYRPAEKNYLQVAAMETILG